MPEVWAHHRHEGAKPLMATLMGPENRPNLHCAGFVCDLCWEPFDTASELGECGHADADHLGPTGSCRACRWCPCDCWSPPYEEDRDSSHIPGDPYDDD